MPGFLERMKAKEEEQRRNREEIMKRQEEIEAEMEWQRGENEFLVESLEGEETTIATLYAAGELTKGQPVQYDVPWPEDKNGVRTRPVIGMVAEDGHGRALTQIRDEDWASTILSSAPYFITTYLRLL